MRIRVGTSGFQYPEWKGGFYPEIMPAKKMLPYYAERFATTEINYTFRRFPSRSTIDAWHEATPDEFAFSFKAPQRITHFARLRDCGDTVKAFAGAIEPMKQKLGPVLFQLPPNFKKDAVLLSHFLHQIPAGIRGAFEFRHASWFEDEVFAVLAKGNAALCIAEDEDLATPAVATAGFGYLRLRREDYTERDLKKWRDFIANQNGKWEDAFVYFKHEEKGVGPKFGKRMMELVEA